MLNFKLWLESKQFKTEFGIVHYGQPHQDDLADYFAHVSLQDPIYIENLFICPQFRGQGMGRKLFQQFMESTPTSDYILQAYPHESPDDFATNREKLISFYRSFGFQHVGDGWMFLKK